VVKLARIRFGDCYVRFGAFELAALSLLAFGVMELEGGKREEATLAAQIRSVSVWHSPKGENPSRR